MYLPVGGDKTGWTAETTKDKHGTSEYQRFGGGAEVADGGGGRHINYKSKWNLLAEFECIGCDDEDGGRRVFFSNAFRVRLCAH